MKSHFSSDFLRDLPTSGKSDTNAQRNSFFENSLLSYKEAARYLSVSESYLRRLKRRGLVPCVFIGDRGIRFRVSSLNRWIEKREVS
jgi:excisionase family DNA binding protein